MNISEIGLELIRKYEGCKLTAYPDPGSGGAPWTIGYGHTGHDVYPGLHITQEQADEFLRRDIVWVEKCLSNSVKVEITQNQYDALCSFIYNLGCAALGKSTLLAKLNAGDDEGAAQEFGKWVKASGHILAGLVARRQAEAEVFST